MKTFETSNIIGLAVPTAVAVDNGGTNTRIWVERGGELQRVTYETPANYDDAIWRLGAEVDLLTMGDAVHGVGFAIAGKLDNAATKIEQGGLLGEYGWVGKPFRRDVADVLMLEPSAVTLMNDCIAAAKAQQVVNRKSDAPEIGFVEAISTGFGGAGFNGDRLIADEPGHEFLRPGAMCGCGKEGCAEAHMSGSGIERKFGISAKGLPKELWDEVIADAVEAHARMINRHSQMGFEPSVIYYFGSVITKSPYLLNGLKAGLQEARERLAHLPELDPATYGENSGMYGALYAARQSVA